MRGVLTRARKLWVVDPTDPRPAPDPRARVVVVDLQSHVLVPKPPTSGTKILKSVDGVVSWADPA